MTSVICAGHWCLCGPFCCDGFARRREHDAGRDTEPEKTLSTVQFSKSQTRDGISALCSRMDKGDRDPARVLASNLHRCDHRANVSALTMTTAAAPAAAATATVAAATHCLLCTVPRKYHKCAFFGGRCFHSTRQNETVVRVFQTDGSVAGSCGPPTQDEVCKSRHGPQRQC